MTVSAEIKPIVPTMGTPKGDYVLGSGVGQLDQPRMFKKHKHLPHPRREVYPGAPGSDVRSTPRRGNLEVNTVLSRSSGSVNSLQRPRRLPGGPEPPPTPPAHSRKSSGSHSVNPSSPTYVATPLQSTENIQSGAPTTPTNQQTPPTPNLTPDRTPPGIATRQSKPRPPISERIPSKVTIDSRTASFRTAPENPYSSGDDDDGRSTLRALPPSAKTSQSTVRQVNGDKKPKPQVVGLGLGLESSPGDELTPRTAKEFNAFDGDWADKGGSGSEVEEQWDDNLGRNVKVRKRRSAVRVNERREVVEDVTVTPTNATKALRSMSLMESPVVYPSRRVVSDRFPLVRAVPSNSESSISSDFRRSSMMSTKSTASTIVEAILVETAPQRRQTLRHVKKQMGLRDSRSDLSPTSSAPTSVSAYVDAVPRSRLSNVKVTEAPRESQASATTFNSISSHKARREVRKNGGIPVVVIPERRSSVKSSSKEPSLRSTSSRRSKRSQSVGSVPLSHASKAEPVIQAERVPRRNKTVSGPDGSQPGDQRTMDFPPVVPRRSSSLSAPTSRNASRTGSLTAESLKAHNAFQAQQGHQLQGVHRMLEKLHLEKPHGHDKAEQALEAKTQDAVKADVPKTPIVQVDEPRPEILIRRATSIESRKSGDARYSRGYPESHDTHDDHSDRLHVDRYGDPFFGRRLSVQNTPFSQASMDTTGTSHAEVSEAMAINIYPHQNKSLMIVDHSNKPSENSSLERHKSLDVETPTVQVPNIDGVPVTPPQTFSMDDVDSPLRNPRAPPEPPAAPPSFPPAINFIPATPSGLTPAVEKQKQLGNYYEVADEKPKRRPSLLQRTFSNRGRTKEYGPSPVRRPSLLKRTLSLSRGSSRARSEWDEGSRPGVRRHSMLDDRPPDESRLHPFWRPTYADESDSGSDDEGEWVDETSGGRTFKYPKIDNRPSMPRRSLSARVKRTFAILPVRDSYDEGRDPLARRTIRRTPSGNLRVMQFRRSLESLPRIPTLPDGRPYTAPGGDDDHRGRRRQGRPPFRFWMTSPKSSGDSFPRRRSSSFGGVVGVGLLPALGNKINIPRRMSERRREKRTQELRRMISSPREVRDGVGDVIRPAGYRETYERERQLLGRRDGGGGGEKDKGYYM
ncbi:hypothetical protein QBC47DRAFT_222757 [Echria macrotheca]|uniref:Uncharacterized protein n=1 Tax=Echria macrotheca TaxID=438768 RepID=A0AAJ0BAD5_9PEZI|nr:hypothetical protein QBC47DRAFT_222757 [Echria macrotheca]